MKNLLLLFSICLLMFSCNSKSEDKKEGSATDDLAAVNAAIDQMKNCLLEPTEQNLKELTSPNLTYGHSAGKIEDQAEFIRVLVTGENDYKAFEASEQVIKIEGNTAWVRHIMDATVGVAGEDLKPHLNVLTVWVKSDGKWKLLARQAVKV